MVSWVGLETGIGRSLNQNGDLVQLSDNLNREVSFQQIAKDDPLRKQQLEGLFLANGVKLSDSSGNLNGSLSGRVSGKVPVIGYGITDQIGVFASLPILQFQFRTQYDFTSSAATQGFLNSLNASGQGTVAKTFEAALSTSLESKLNRIGYEYRPNFNRTFVGDLQLMAMRVSVPEFPEDIKTANQLVLTLPTATGIDLQDLYGVRVSDQRWGIGARQLVELPLKHGFQLNGSAGLQYLFARDQSRRIPLSIDDDLNEGYDPAAEISGGMRASLQAQLRYVFPKVVGLSQGISWQKKWDDQISGSRYESANYEWASDRSGFDLTSYYASIDFNSIPSFLTGNFLIPVIAEFGVGLPIMGRNAMAEPVFQFQGTLFF